MTLPDHTSAGQTGTSAILAIDGTGLLCVTLILRLRAALDGVAPGTLVHVTATDPAAPLDLPAWCHLTGHHYLGPVGEHPLRYALKVADRVQPTQPNAPWHPIKNED